MILIILATLAVVVVLLDGLIIFGLCKLFRVAGATLLRSVFLAFAILLVGVCVDTLVAWIGFGGISVVLTTVVLFGLWYVILWKFYSCSLLKAALTYTAHIALFLLLTLFAIWFRAEVAAPFVVSGNSMVPAYVTGDYVFVERYPMAYASGDVIVTRTPNLDRHIITRVIATGGEHIEVRDGNVYLDGEKLNEPYASEPTEGEYAATLRDNQLFVLGDNRSTALDSRNFGTIPINIVEGIVIFTIPELFTY